jgi:hypothetical protein
MGVHEHPFTPEAPVGRRRSDRLEKMNTFVRVKICNFVLPDFIVFGVTIPYLVQVFSSASERIAEGLPGRAQGVRRRNACNAWQLTQPAQPRRIAPF